MRRAGLDFAAGDVLLKAGRRMGPAELALAAAMNHASLPVARRPRVAILATGDELVPPGAEPGPDQIVASNNFAVGAYARQAGADVLDLGIAGDDFAALEAAIRRAREAKADVLVTLGGASVGDHDLVQTALTREGMELGFWRIAMRPGKPFMHGRIGDMRILGLPGNPVSAIVCAVLFLVAARARALRRQRRRRRRHAPRDPRRGPARERPAAGLPARDAFGRRGRQAGRHRLHAAGFRPCWACWRSAHALIVRPPHAPAAKAGEPCRYIPL